MRYYMIAGEASGDLHGSNLIKEIRKLDVDAHIRCWGGDLMQSAGGEVVKHYRDLAFMGFVEVVANLRTIMRNMQFCKKDILAFKPDALILIDYPGFNLRIAKWARSKGIRTIYYISPQVWAWNESRVKEIKRNVDKMLVILPFEQSFYEKWKYEVDYVGHPLVQVIDEAQQQMELAPPPISSPLNEKNIIALLPGSRKQEIEKKLPVMLEASRNFPDYRFVVAKATSLGDEFYQPFLENFSHVRTIRNKTYELLQQAKAACVTSGTATLETALFGVPEVVCYKGSPISYQIAKRLIKVKFISLVNLIMDREVVKELIQDEFNAENLTRELQRILSDPETIARMKKDYAELKLLLSKGGKASAQAAKIIFSMLNRSTASIS